MQGTVFIALASLGVAVWLVSTGQGLPAPPTQAFLGRGPLAARATSELEAAKLLRETDLPEGRRHIVAGWPGFAVALYAGRTGDVTVIRTQELPEYVDTLWVDSVLVLLVGTGEAALPAEVVEAELGLAPGLALDEQWRAGSWACYRVERSGTGNR